MSGVTAPTPRAPSFQPVREIRPGALGVLTPPQRGLALAIIQAERCGRGGEDLEGLAKPNRFAHNDDSGRVQLSQRMSMLSQWPPTTAVQPRSFNS